MTDTCRSYKVFVVSMDHYKASSILYDKITNLSTLKKKNSSEPQQLVEVYVNFSHKVENWAVHKRRVRWLLDADAGAFNRNLKLNLKLFLKTKSPGVESTDCISYRLILKNDILTLTNGILTLTMGILTMTNGILTMINGILIMTNGILTMINGISTMTNGILIMTNGILTMTSGILPLTNGILTLTRGISLHMNQILKLSPFFISANKGENNDEKEKEMSDRNTIEMKLRKSLILILNAQHAEFQPSLQRFNYTPERIAEGQALYDDTKAADEQQKQSMGEQLKATRELNAKSSEAKEFWMEIVLMAKRALQGSDTHIKDLGINGMRPSIFEEWIAEAETFYNNALANPDILAKLAEFSIDETILQAGKAMLTPLLPLNAEQEKKKSDAQRATLARNKLLAQLWKWRGDLLQAARIAFKDDPQVLEAFKVRVYTPGYQKKTTPAPTDPPTDPTTDPGTGT